VSEVQTEQGALTIAVLRDATLHIEAQRHLTDARNAAEAARAAQAALLASMNHEMRTPLNGVLGYAQLLARATNLTERQREQLRVIQSCGDHLLALVADALDMARHEAGKAELHLERTDLVQTARAVADIVNLRAKEAGLQFVLELDEQLPRAVLADDRRLRQVLLNLLANAIKFTERGCVTLKVLLQGLHDKTASVRFDVVDTGIGMSREQVDSVFHPFAQFGTAGKRALGTGLGMTISQQLVQLMGGNIEVSSTPGVGSTFSFELQLRVTSVAEVPVND
jgi:signal transduction histidine kinase